MATLTKKSKSILRYKGEVTALILAFLICSIAIFLFFQIDLLTFGLLLLFVIIYIRILQANLLGNALQISETQFSRIYNEAKECSQLLGLKRMPPIYVTQDPVLNAFAIGFGKKHAIVLSSAVVENLTLEEISAVIGHEMGHILFNHTSLLSIIAPVGSYIPIADILLGFWIRRAEYTCDRCALICAKDKNIMYSTLAKIAIGPNCGKYVDIGELSSQLQEINKSKIGTIAEATSSHPYLLKRLWRISQFSSIYNIIPCSNCGEISKQGINICESCSPLIQTTTQHNP